MNVTIQMATHRSTEQESLTEPYAARATDQGTAETGKVALLTVKA